MFWRTDVAAAILWPPDAKSQLIGKDPDAGKDWGQEEKGVTEDEMVGASLTRWTWVWANSGRWWWTGKPGVLQSMGSQRIGYSLVTEDNKILMPPPVFFLLYHMPLSPPPPAFSLSLSLSHTHTHTREVHSNNKTLNLKGQLSRIYFFYLIRTFNSFTPTPQESYKVALGFMVINIKYWNLQSNKVCKDLYCGICLTLRTR